MPRFFINRPIFAVVIAIMTMLAGLLAIKTLPVSQYPPIAPPQIAINAVYAGASAQTVQDTVTQVIEQKLNGIDNLIYMSSTSDSSGAASITLTFKSGTDPNIAQVQVQNKLQLAVPLLPQVVQRQGIAVVKSTRNFLLVVGLVSEDGSLDRNALADYMVTNLQDSLSRLDGVGELLLFGTQNAMRIWLNPDKLHNFQLTTDDVIAALQAQNAQISAGQFGGTPAAKGQQLNATITARTLLQTTDQFDAIILRTNSDGSTVRLKDVARSEIGTENYDIQSFYNGRPMGGMAIRLASGANALETVNRVKAKLEERSGYFPPGMKVVYPYDTTPFVRISIQEVVQTLIGAVFLVFIIMFIFLQNIRATLIPTIAVPVVLLGTMAVLAAAGFSINTLTMFALVIVIGLLVDDAIVVVENVERIMYEEGLSPHDATIKSMGQITSALWGIATVLTAVFLPMAFFGGSTGVIYRQFSITIISAMILSVLVAMILTPALCAIFLKPIEKGHRLGEASWFRWFFRWFNQFFEAGKTLYERIVGSSFKKPVRYLIIYGTFVVVMGLLFVRLPTAFLPDEDQGFLICQVQLPAGATQERTIQLARQLEKHFLEQETRAVEGVITVTGFSFAGNGQNMGLAFVRLKDWDLRNSPDLKAQAVAGRAMKAFSQFRDGLAFAFSPPAVMELGVANGFDLQLQDRSGLGHEALMAARNQLLGMAMKNPKLVAVRPNGQDDTPQFKLDIDDRRAGAYGVALTDINDTLSTAWGSSYVNDFIQNGRVKKVYLQSDARYRMLPADIYRWYVRSESGEMVPFSSFATAHWQYSSPRLERYNGIPSMEILGQAAAGISTGEAMAEIEKMADQLPAGIGYEWTGLSYEEKNAGAQAPALYAISLLVVFLSVAALYESWTIPFVNLLMLPLGLVGAVTAVTLRVLPNDIYLHIGLLTTLGLSTKNAILIIQFIKARLQQGHELMEATMMAVDIRLRPVIMTSLAFFFGTLPLALTKGAGAAAQNAIGTAVTGGLLSATFIDLIFIPFFFVMVSRLFGRGKYKPQAKAPVVATVAIVLIALSGCASMAPKYVRPDAPAPSEWPNGPAYKETQTRVAGASVADIAWQDFFVDPQLREVICMALKNNRDLRVAALNIERSQALYRIQRADLLPTIDATADGNFQRVPEDFSPTGQPETLHQYIVGLGVSAYELDLFGRVRSLKDQALKQYFATEQAQRSIRISLVSQVATAYLNLAADRERLKLAQETLTSQRSSYELTRRRFDSGVSSALDLQQARTTVDSARVDLARFTTLAAQDENALNLVVGSKVEDMLLPQALSETLMPLNDIAPGLPSDVLLNRPDILEAENLLQGFNANIGAARAAFFPRIVLVSSVGFGSNELAGLFRSGSFAWNFAPSISLPIFDAGRNRANLKVAEVDRDIAVAQYEKAIQTAFQEVADALALRGTIDDQLSAQQSLTDATGVSYSLSRARYEKGVESYLAVLDSQRSLYAAQQNLIAARLSRLINLVTLYKVLGGGAAE